MDYFLEIFNEVTLLTPSTGAIIAGLLACGLLFVSGFASGSEIAFFSLSPADLNELDEEKTEEDQHIKQLREDSERTLATILITNNLVNVTIIMLFGYFFDHAVNFGKAWWLEFVCMTVLLTFLLLLFGEIMPKVYAGQQPLRFCRGAVNGILFCRKLFYPFASIVVSSGRLADKVVQKENHVLSVDDLEQALELTDKEEIKDEQRILEGIVRFGDETAKEIMTSRQDVVDLDFKSSYQEVLQCIVENNYSRIPVYQDSIDNIRGILYIKDLLPHLGKPASFRWQSLIRPPYFVPETKKIDDLLREFQENKVHIAIVVDIHDLIEVTQQRLSFKDVGIGVHADVVAFLLVVLVVYLAHNLFENVLQSNEAAGAAELIDDDGDVHLVLLEVAQQVVNFLGFRYKVGRPDERLPTECRRL